MQYPGDWNGVDVAVVGLGVSNLELVRFLSAQGAHISARDRKEPEAFSKEQYEFLKSTCRELVLGPGYLKGLDCFHWVFLTPGMRKDLPEVKRAELAGSCLTTEMDLFFALCPCPVIGVTGSAGKTTTTTLIGEIMTLHHKEGQVFVGGNSFGRPLLNEVGSMRPADWAVVELSSFQLQLMQHSPNIAAVTNVTPNHLDVHSSWDEYKEAKMRIFRFQSTGDWTVLNYDNDVTRRMAEAVPSSVVFFHRAPLEEGAFLQGDALVWSPPGSPKQQEAVCHLGDIRLRGSHNVENVLAAIAVARLAGVRSEVIRGVVHTFQGVPHRLEFVRRLEGISFYNDSISTTPERAIAGIDSFEEPLVVIAGGYDKKLPFEEFARRMAGKVRVLLLLGATADKIERAVSEVLPPRARPRIQWVRDLAEAVEQAYRAARPGDVVLLSPACASYDMFANFEERGELFRRLVWELDGKDRSPLVSNDS